MIPTKKQLRLLLMFVTGLFLFGCTIFLFLVIFVYSQLDGTSLAPKIDCVLVFGAAVHKGSVSGPGIERRVKTAANLYTSGKVSRLLLSGGKGDELHDSEAEVMRRTAMRYGVDPDDIYLEDKATSTWENLMNSKVIVDEMACTAPIVGISDGYHLARIRFLAFRQGWENFRTLPAGDRPDKVFERLSILREVLGILYYSLDIFIDVDGY